MTKVTALCQCGESDPAEFYADRKRADGLHAYCKACCKRRAKARYAALTDEEKAERTRKHREYVKANPEKIAAHKRLSAYGLTDEAFAFWLSKQDGVCGICRGPMVPICVDHDHSTGAVRGLLCSDCNKALGFLRDDPRRALAAATYLDGDERRAVVPAVSMQTYADR